MFYSLSEFQDFPAAVSSTSFFPVTWMLSNKLNCLLNTLTFIRRQCCLYVDKVLLTLSVSALLTSNLVKRPGNFRTQWKTPRRRGYTFNLTTEPVNWLLLPLWQFICSITQQFLDVRFAVEKWAVQQQNGPQHSSSGLLLGSMEKDLCDLTCLWGGPYPRQHTANHGATG